MKIELTSQTPTTPLLSIGVGSSVQYTSNQVGYLQISFQNQNETTSRRCCRRLTSLCSKECRIFFLSGFLSAILNAFGFRLYMAMQEILDPRTR